MQTLELCYLLQAGNETLIYQIKLVFVEGLIQHMTRCCTARPATIYFQYCCQPVSLLQVLVKLGVLAQPTGELCQGANSQQQLTSQPVVVVAEAKIKAVLVHS